MLPEPVYSEKPPRPRDEVFHAWMRGPRAALFRRSAKARSKHPDRLLAEILDHFIDSEVRRGIL